VPKQCGRLRLHLWGWFSPHLLYTPNARISTTTKSKVKRGKKAIHPHCLLPRAVRPWLSADPVRRSSQYNGAGGCCR